MTEPTSGELSERAKTAADTLAGRGRKATADPFQVAVIAAAVQRLLVGKGICTQEEFDHAVLTEQANLLEAMVAATAAPALIVPGSIIPFPAKN